VLETQVDGRWIAIRLWDNAHSVDEHHEHEYTSSQGKRDPMVRNFNSVNQGPGSRTLADDCSELDITMSVPQPIGPATRKVLAMIDSSELDARYPHGTHFVDAQHPHQAQLISAALFHGDPVVVAYLDGREVLFTPKPTDRLVAVVLKVALFWIKLRERPSTHEPIQLPPRTQVEVRDASGLPFAA
jgi:hypothetical protein